MSSAEWVTVASVAAVVVSALAIATGLKGVRDQLRIAVFLEYTKRYAKIMHDMPYEAREPGSGYTLASLPKEERYRVLAIFREYLNMCSEERWLHDHRRIDHPTWNTWETGIRNVADFPCFHEAWARLSHEYEAYEGFTDFVNQLLKDIASRDPRHANGRLDKLLTTASLFGAIILRNGSSCSRGFQVIDIRRYMLVEASRQFGFAEVITTLYGAMGQLVSGGTGLAPCPAAIASMCVAISRSRAVILSPASWVVSMNRIRCHRMSMSG